MSGSYDEHIGQILNISDNPDEILEEWGKPGPLFQYCAGHSSNPKIGCLTQIKSGKYIAEKFTAEIRMDENIHKSEYELIHDIVSAKNYEDVVNILWPYAKWHRVLDRELCRLEGTERIFSMDRKYVDEFEKL